MVRADSIVFVSDASHLESAVAGGVQVCTSEYIDLLGACGLGVELFPVSATRRISTRVKIKLGLEVYERYEFSRLFQSLVARIDRTGSRFVAMNQVALTGLAPLLKRHYGSQIKTIILSHGNESGDFLHAISHATPPASGLTKLRDICRLGYLVYNESVNFSNYIDCVFCLSETELQINNWLGARKGLVIPRTFRPIDINWSPQPNRVGFVGSLNHKPNYDGLILLIEEIERLGAIELKIRVVGGPANVGKQLQSRHRSVEFVGNISDTELRAEAATWSMFVNPVFWYARGASTKLATGINWGIPIVSTPPGNRGYVWRDGSLLTVNAPREMAEVIVSAAGNREKIQRLSEQVRRVAASGPTLQELSVKVRSCLELEC